MVGDRESSPSLRLRSATSTRRAATRRRTVGTSAARSATPAATTPATTSPFGRWRRTVPHQDGRSGGFLSLRAISLRGIRVGSFFDHLLFVPVGPVVGNLDRDPVLLGILGYPVLRLKLADDPFKGLTIGRGRQGRRRLFRQCPYEIFGRLGR